jgi:hypothetical protein
MNGFCRNSPPLVQTDRQSPCFTGNHRHRRRQIRNLPSIRPARGLRLPAAGVHVESPDSAHRALSRQAESNFMDRSAQAAWTPEHATSLAGSRLAPLRSSCSSPNEGRRRRGPVPSVRPWLLLKLGFIRLRAAAASTLARCQSKPGPWAWPGSGIATWGYGQGAKFSICR